MARGDVVARVQSIVYADKVPVYYGYEAGKFYLLASGSQFPGTTHIVPGVVLRGGMQSQCAVLQQDLLLQVGDVIVTGPSTLAAIEFLIGGRVGINYNTRVEIVNERSVADGSMSFARLVKKNVSMWVKADAKTLKQPIEIQTNGGTLGIKG